MFGWKPGHVMKSLLLSAKHKQNSIRCFLLNFKSLSFCCFLIACCVCSFFVAYIPDRNTDTFTHYQTNPELNQQTNKGKNFIKNCVVKVVTYLSDFVQGIERIKMGMKDCQTYKQTL